MKYIFLILSFFNLGIFAENKIEDFNSDIQNGYDKYEVLLDEQNSYYMLKLVWGINEGEVNYGVYFYNEDPAKLTLRVYINNRLYDLPSTSRSDVAVPAFKTSKKTNDLRIVIFDNKGRIHTEKKIVNANSVDEFLVKSNLVLDGANHGLVQTKLKIHNEVNTYAIMLFVLLSIIVLSASIIVVLIISKKGMFDQDSRKEDVYNFNDLLPYIEEEARVILEQLRQQQKTSPEKDYNFQDASVVNQEAYTKNHRYDDDINIKFDTQTHLKEAGFNPNYSELTEAEKDLIMLELMRLRDKGMLTVEQYNYEVIKLWS